MIALSGWEEKRWNEKAEAGGKIQNVCWQSSGGSFGVCSPRQPMVPADTLDYPLESRGIACREWQMPPAQVVALLEVGQLPGDAFLGRKCTFGKTRDGSGAQIHHTWLSGLEAPKGTECGRIGGIAQTFFNKYKSYARASQMSCIRISHLPCLLVVC